MSFNGKKDFETDIRLKQRFQNFNSAFLLFRSTIEENDLDNLYMIER